MLKNKNSDVILQKDKLCKIINNKYRDIKTHGENITDEMRLKIYNKDINYCDKGESKGGYSLKEVQEMAIHYFKLPEKKAFALSKPELCKHISNMLENIKNKVKTANLTNEKHMENPDKHTGDHIGDGDGDGDGDDDGHKIKKTNALKTYNMIYPADITQCTDTPNRGGKNIKEIKKIAIENFGIDIEHKSKEELCSEIETKLKKLKNKLDIVDNNNDTDIDLDEIMKDGLSVDDFFESIPSK